ncbi:hypothetical protein LMG8526HA_02024 [Lactococcus lactis]|uniref:TIGR02391 family protein n=1 Tax=Lactococcus lactis TaxID=1358 RepID=UPI00071C23D1|nr:TIGR02391 family protein [Lactococcus lactis]KSU10849.1 phage protein [Lactococcus lactis subsp. lactis]MDU0401138.1 hypothetical protein [Lactococcus lactis]
MNVMDNQVIESISRILGEELTGSSITKMFHILDFVDHDIERGYTNTKWRRIDESVTEKCAKLNNPRPLFDAIEYISKPINYVHHPESWNNLKKAINSTLIFTGYELKDDGHVYKVKAARTFDEAQTRLKSLHEEISSLNLHHQVTKYCTEELLQQDYFHAVFEASKGVFNRIRDISGLTIDGQLLLDKAFDFKNQPLILIQGNSLKTQDEKNQYFGLINSIKTCLYLYRNHQAHVPKIYDELSLNDAIRGLMLISLAHELLDHCVFLTDFHK